MNTLKTLALHLAIKLMEFASEDQQIVAVQYSHRAQFVVSTNRATLFEGKPGEWHNIR